MDNELWDTLYQIATRFSKLAQQRQDFIEWLDAHYTVNDEFITVTDMDAAWKQYMARDTSPLPVASLA